MRDWAAAAERVRAADVEVVRTLAHCDADRGPWLDAVARFRAALANLYAPFRGVRQRLRAGEDLELALSFLEADVDCFRSGYLKADLLRGLAHAPLDADQRRRARDVVLLHVGRPRGRLLPAAGRLAAAVVDDGLRARLQAVEGERRQQAARQVLAAVEHQRRSDAGRRRPGP